MNKKIRTYKSSNVIKAKKKVNHSTIESFQHRRTEKQPKKENLFNDPKTYQKRKTQELIVTSKPLTIKRTSSLARRIVIQRSPSKNVSIEPVRELKPKNDYSLNIYKRALNTPEQKKEDNVYRRDSRNTRSFYELNRINTLGRTESIDSLKVMKRMPSRGKTIINLSSKEFNIINKNNINPYKNLYKHNAKDLSPSSISFRRIEQSPNRIDERSFNMYDRIKKMKS